MYFPYTQTLLLQHDGSKSINIRIHGVSPAKDWEHSCTSGTIQVEDCTTLVVARYYTVFQQQSSRLVPYVTPSSKKVRFLVLGRFEWLF